MRHSIHASYFITCYNAQKERNSSPKKCGTAIHESVESGDNVIVRTSLKSMGYVCGGAQAVIEALIETVGENGNDYDADTIVEES